MELINYLNENFYTKAQLLEVTQLGDTELSSFQSAKVMPAASYRLTLNTECDSYFGEYRCENTVEYYAKGYAAWIGVLQVQSGVDRVYEIFSDRYQRKLTALREAKFYNTQHQLNKNLSAHLIDEWAYFLDGTYGLCTRSGLPEDIAAKELAIAIINELLDRKSLAAREMDRLKNAVDLLDSVGSMFAPHERIQSSSHRLITEVRCKFGFPVNRLKCEVDKCQESD